MLTVLCVAFLLLGIGMFIWNYFDNYEDAYNEDAFQSARYWVRGTFGVIGFLVFVALFITIMCFIPKVATEQKYETRIEVVQESNTLVEEQICAAVESYLAHEENIYESLDITTAIGLFSAYPNLKSDDLVQSLITTYQNNAAEIKALKLERVNLTTLKYLLYFGH